MFAHLFGIVLSKLYFGFEPYYQYSPICAGLFPISCVFESTHITNVRLIVWVCSQQVVFRIRREYSAFVVFCLGFFSVWGGGVPINYVFDTFHITSALPFMRLCSQ